MISYKDSGEIDPVSLGYNNNNNKNDKITEYFESTQHNDGKKTAKTEINGRHQIAQSVPVATRREQIDSLLDENLRLCSNEFQINNLLNSNSSETSLSNQWWQLFDTKLRKFYYYNPHEQRSTWQRPQTNKSTTKPHGGDEKENVNVNESSQLDLEETSSSVVVIPLASKLIERINGNLHLLKRSKKFLRLLKRKIDVDLSYDANDLNIITTLTERLLNIQTILTQEEGESITPSSSSSTFFDMSELEMNHGAYLDNSHMSPTTNPKLGTSTVTCPQSNDSNTNSASSLMSSCYSFQSIENNSPSSGTSTQKRRLQPRTNPNYINVDFINTRNGSLIKNTYVKLQDLTNSSLNEDPDVSNQLKVSPAKKNPLSPRNLSNQTQNSFSTISQAVLLLISLLNSSIKAPAEKQITKKTSQSSNKPGTRPSNLSQSSSINTVCSLNNIYSKMNNEALTRHEQICLSLGSSSATLISENSLNNTDMSANTASNTTSRLNKKRMMTFKSAADMSVLRNNNMNYSASLTKKNLEKNKAILKTALTSEFNDNLNSSLSPRLLNSNHERSSITKQSSNRSAEKHQQKGFSLFKRANNNNNTSTTKDSDHAHLDSPMQQRHDHDFNINDLPNQSTPNPPTSQQKDIKSSQKLRNLNKELFSGSSSSSLADIRNISESTQGPFNQRLQTFKRSFNKKTSFKKIKSPDVIFNINDTSNGDSFNNDLNNSFESQRFPFASFDLIDSPLQAKKQSQTNLLLLNNTFIDLNTSHHSRKIRNGFLLFSAKKKVPQSDLLTWTVQSIQKPLIKTNDKVVKKEACELFKLIQIYMGDRKLTSNFLPNISDTSAIANSSFNKKYGNGSIVNSMTINDIKNSQTQTKLYHKNLICLQIMTKGWLNAQLRDELYMQLVKQTSENKNKPSLMLGWELITISLSFFPPSQKLFPFLTEYIFSKLTKLDGAEMSESFLASFENTDETAFSIYLIESAKKMPKTEEMANRMAHTCLKRLERIHVTGAKKGLKKPTLDEILLSRQTITSPSLFGTTLEEIMSVQESKCPDLMLPWIQTTLSEAVLRLHGSKTEGIFRVPGDLDEVNNLKVKYDQLWCSSETLSIDKDAKNFEDFMANIQDAHLPASLLKLWYRELYEPLIPNEFYEECIRNCDRPIECISVIQRLPHINKLVFTYLIKFLKVFAASENVAITKMDASNLSMIMAPNCLRCKSNEPKVIMENTKKEMQFLNTLIHNLDTSSVQDLD